VRGDAGLLRRELLLGGLEGLLALATVGGTAPPRMRRTAPRSSSVCRSVRTVTVDTSKRRARSATRANPRSWTRDSMRSWRSSAGASASAGESAPGSMAGDPNFAFARLSIQR
jgi:hypothetical protein